MQNATIGIRNLAFNRQQLAAVAAAIANGLAGEAAGWIVVLNYQRTVGEFLRRANRFIRWQIEYMFDDSLLCQNTSK